jgi:hypothetical protein
MRDFPTRRQLDTSASRRVRSESRARTDRVCIRLFWLLCCVLHAACFIAACCMLHALCCRWGSSHVLACVALPACLPACPACLPACLAALARVQKAIKGSKKPSLRPSLRAFPSAFSGARRHLLPCQPGCWLLALYTVTDVTRVLYTTLSTTLSSVTDVYMFIEVHR